jgi:hypothetical protein
MYIYAFNLCHPPINQCHDMLLTCRFFFYGCPIYIPSIIITDDGFIKGFYSGFGPILFKQIPYTMAKFAVQGAAAEKIYSAIGKTPAVSLRFGY